MARYAFFLEDSIELEDPNRSFALSSKDLALINPNTGTLPTFHSHRDADLTLGIYYRVPVLWNERKRDGNPWGLTFKRLFDMTDDSDLFRTRETLDREGWRLDGNVFTRDGKSMLPLYEAKMVDFFNHRAADVIKSETALNRQYQPRYLSTQELEDPGRCAIPLSWIANDGRIPSVRNGKNVAVPGVSERLAEVIWNKEWLCGWCDITSATNERTSIPAFLPRAAVGNTMTLMFSRATPPLVAMPLSLFWSCGDAGLCPGEGWVGEFDGGGCVVPGAVLAGLLDLAGVVPGALDDAGIGAFAPPVQVPRAGDLGDGTFEGVLLIRGEKPGRRPGGG